MTSSSAAQLARAVVLPQPGEAPQLALEVARRAAVALEAARAPVGGVDLDERVDQLARRSAALQALRQLGGDHVAVDALHHVERRAGDGLVVARRQHARDAHVRALERAQQQRLAQHVVRGRRQRRPRRAAQDPFTAVAPDHVGDVGVPVADRLGLDLAAAEPVRVEEGLERTAHEQRRAVERRGLLRGVDDRGQAARS